VQAVRRVDGQRATIPIADLVSVVPGELEAIQAQMLDTARRERDANISIACVRTHRSAGSAAAGEGGVEEGRVLASALWVGVAGGL
jgi:hypothetical protein